MWNMFKFNNKTLQNDDNDFALNFEHISHLALVFLLLILKRQLLAVLLEHVLLINHHQ